MRPRLQGIGLMLFDLMGICDAGITVLMKCRTPRILTPLTWSSKHDQTAPARVLWLWRGRREWAAAGEGGSEFVA